MQGTPPMNTMQPRSKGKREQRVSVKERCFCFGPILPLGQDVEAPPLR